VRRDAGTVVLDDLARAATDTLRDIAPIAFVILAFQGAVLRRRPAHLRAILVGAAHVFAGLTLFRLGLADSLLPIGAYMAEQLAQAAAVGVSETAAAAWHRYLWLYAFAAAIGFSATLVEPALIAVAERVREMTGGELHPLAFRLVIAIGSASGLLIGTLRIVLGVPLEYVLATLVGIIAILTMVAPKRAVPLALDSGAIATSVVTVPLIAAFAVGVADAIPGRDAFIEGFGLVSLALLLPVASVLAFASVHARRRRGPDTGGKDAV
jgi:Protein of unknown function (DUF1538)